jgi:hypothetical protein
VAASRPSLGDTQRPNCRSATLNCPRATFTAKNEFNAYAALGNSREFERDVDSAIRPAHCDLIEINALGAMLTSVLYLDVQKQVPIVPANSRTILLQFDYSHIGS